MARTTADKSERGARGGGPKPAMRRRSQDRSDGTKTAAAAQRRKAGGRFGDAPRDPQGNGHPGEAANPPLPIFTKGPAAAARIRMYRQGLGDCFLVTLPRAAGSQKPSDFHILLDCGVILGTENKGGR